jgi:hypothetical protein
MLFNTPQTNTFPQTSWPNNWGVLYFNQYLKINKHHAYIE